MLRRSITGESQPAVVKYGMCANADDADADEEFEEEEEEDGDDRADVPFGGLHMYVLLEDFVACQECNMVDCCGEE
jgi:hypothetical protein